MDISMPSTSQNCSLQSVQNNGYYTVVSGTLHQGDVRFAYPGVQCTFISFWALVLMENKSPLLWNTTDIDSCIVNGNDRFIRHCFKMEIQPRQLLVKELPQSSDTHNSLIQLSQLDSAIKVGMLNQPLSIGETNVVFVPIEEAILGCFHRFNSCFLVCGGQTIAIAKRQNRFFVFDSHSRGPDGLLHHMGSAVLVSFIQIQDLISFVKKLLIESLRLKPSEQFELVPVTVCKHNCNTDKETGSAKCKESNTLNPNKQVATITMALDSSPIPNQKAAVLHERDMQLYFTDQKKRDPECKETAISNHLDVSKHAARKKYMMVYMQMKRRDDSFRKKSNAVSLKSKQKLRKTEEGRHRLNKQAAESRQRMLSTEDGRQKLKEQSAERKNKLLSTEMGRLIHKQQSAEGMQRMLTSTEGRLKHRKRSAEVMRKMLSSEEGKLKHRKRSAEGMKKMLSSEEGRLKHNRSAAKVRTKLLSSEKGRLKHRKQSAEGMKKILSTEEGRLMHRKRSLEGMQKILSTEEGRQKHTQRSTEGMKKMRLSDERRQTENDLLKE